MPCSCPGGGDKNSGSRLWGGTAGKAFYDPETGRITKGGKFARPYSQAKAKKSTEKMSIKRYETYVKALGCHGKNREHDPIFNVNNLIKIIEIKFQTHVKPTNVTISQPVFLTMRLTSVTTVFVSILILPTCIDSARD